MSRLQLAIGLADSKATSEPHLVYLGRSGVDLRAALDRSPWPRHLIVPHVTGIPKHNGRAAENARSLLPAVEPAGPSRAQLEQQLAAAQAEIAVLKAQLSGHYSAPAAVGPAPVAEPPAAPAPRGRRAT